MSKNFKKQPSHLQQQPLANALEKINDRNTSTFQSHSEKTHWLRSTGIQQSHKFLFQKVVLIFPQTMQVS